MKQSLEPSLAFTLHCEGGYQCLRSDPGNWTGGSIGSGHLVGSKYGLSAPLIARDVPQLTAQKMRLLTEGDFRNVAAEQFWDPLSCDDLPPGLDLLVFDHGFNSGVGNSARLLQQLAGVRTDGVIGTDTLTAVSHATVVTLTPYLNHDMTLLLQKEMMIDETGSLNSDMRAKLNCLKWRPSLWCCALASMQAVDYRRKRHFSIFGRGWLARVQQRAQAALELCRSSRLEQPPAS